MPSDMEYRWYPARNMTDEVIPAFACCALAPILSTTAGISGGLKPAISDENLQGQHDYYRYRCLYKPSAWHAAWQDRSMLVFNGQFPIQPSGSGKEFGSVTHDYPAIALLDPAATETGSAVGPKADCWYLASRRRGAFRLLQQDMVLDFDQASPIALKAGHVVPFGLDRVDSQDIVVVTNLSSSRLAGEVLQLGSLVSTPLDPRRSWFNANTPGLHPRQVAVLLENAAYNDTVPAARSGVAVAMVNVISPFHRRCQPVPGSCVMNSAWAGPCEIISAVTAVGTQQCVVAIYTPNTVKYVGRAAAGGITAGRWEAYPNNAHYTPGSGDVELYEWNATANQYHPVLYGTSPVVFPVKNFSPSTWRERDLVRAHSDDDWNLVPEAQEATGSSSSYSSSSTHSSSSKSSSSSSHSSTSSSGSSSSTRSSGSSSSTHSSSSESSGSTSETCYRIPGIPDLFQLPVETNPGYLLAIGANGCLSLVETRLCPADESPASSSSDESTSVP